MQLELIAVSQRSVEMCGCIVCGSAFCKLELVFQKGRTKFYKCLRCYNHTEFISLDMGAKVSEIEVRDKTHKGLTFKPKLQPHPQPLPHLSAKTS